MLPLRKRDYFFINVYAFALSYLAGAGPLILPQLIERVGAGQFVGTALGALRVLGLLTAIITQPMAGAASDRAPSRKPYIFIGTLGACACLAGLLYAPDYLWLLVAYIALQVTANIAQGASQGFIPDLVRPVKQNSVSGFKTFLEVIASIIAALLIGNLLSRGAWAQAFLTMGATLVGAAVIVWLGVREAERHHPPEQARNKLKLSEVLQVDRTRDGPFLWWLASRFFILLGVYPLSTYALIFVKKTMPHLEPNGITGALLAINAVLIALAAQPAAWLATQFGLKRMVAVSGLLAALGVGLMLLAKGEVIWQAGGILLRDVSLYVAPVGVGMGIFFTTNWALGIALAPKTESGKYLGLSNLGTAGAGLVSALVGGPLIDWMGFTPVFLGGVVSILLGIGLLVNVPNT